MIDKLKLLVLLFAIAFALLFIIGIKDKKNNIKTKEDFSDMVLTCSEYPELLLQVMKERNLKTEQNNYDVYVPCSYDSCEKDILAFENQKTGRKLFSLEGCDSFASKVRLWEILNTKYGQEATKYMPKTFILINMDDVNKFPEYYNKRNIEKPDQMYVLKNFAQRQEGIKLSRDLDEIINGIGKGWFLAQQYLYDPYLISGHKINFRYYLLVVCKNGHIDAWIHNNGFLYYTPEKYDEHDMDFKKHITTGYIDRKIYEQNPLTLEDFREHLDKKDKNSRNKWNHNVEVLMNKVMTALSEHICNNKKLDNHTRFQIFGCDVAPTANLDALLMEINKGPDMGAKDERDKQVKLTVQRDMFKIVDPINIDEYNSTSFIKIF
jgi:hypothetical protein